MLTGILNKILGDKNAKTVKKLAPLVLKINEIETEYQKTVTTGEQVKAKTQEFKERLAKGETVDELLPEAFALVKTACRQMMGKKFDILGNETTWDMIPYDVQLIGGIVLHQGNISEMKTGEGKTLVCTMPVYLNALTGKGVFVVTVNNYLAARDAAWMGQLYNYLGLTVGVTAHGQNFEEKKAAYAADITYGTNNEFGFDYLRDNMSTSLERVVQRNLHYAIVDEVDSILIDEARTPLIISAPAEESTAKYQQYSRLVGQLQEGTHFDIDEKQKTATLTEEGIAQMEKLLGVENIYTEGGFTEVHHIEQALRAKACYKNDVDYMIKDGEVLIIDEFTGRVMAGRRYSHGLHQAIEAKENVEIKRESKTLATISFQNYFRLFDKLAGMTGTAETEAEEFYQIYGLDTVVIPTNKDVVRDDKADSIYKSQKGKFLAAVKKVKELHEKGQPVLVGTISVEKSEVLSKLLQMEGIPHNVLNAKNHAREAEIVANAGQAKAVTIATNMAGRGTDIKLGNGVKELGGLYILGTERHESRRIDNQLRGRSGRQGDPGVSQFFVSMEDDLMRMFGGDRIKGMMEMLKVPEDMPIENRMVSRSIEGAQKKVEGRNFDIRKHLVEYDDIMNVHREIIYKRRRKFLESEDCREDIQEIIEEVAEGIVRNHSDAREPRDWNYKEIFEALTAIHKEESDQLTQEQLEAFRDQKQLIEKAKNYLLTAYKKREESLPEPPVMRRIEKAVFLRSNDTLWMEHIDEMTKLRESVAFSGYAQRDPLNEYKSQAFQMFNELLSMIKTSTVNTLFKIDLSKVIVPQQPAPQNIQTNENQIESPVSGNPAINNPNQQRPKLIVTQRSVPTKEKVVHVSADDSDEKKTTVSAAENLPKASRNDPCPCGSGKKYKKCHGAL